jgi:hypothetical protein
MGQREPEAGLAAEIRQVFAGYGVEVTLHGDFVRDAAGRDYGLGGLLDDLERLQPEPGERAALVRMHVRNLVAAVQGPSPIDTDPREEVLARLYPLLLDGSILAAPDDQPHAPEVAPGIREFLALESREGMQVLTPSAVAELGPLEELRAGARARLRALPVEDHQVRQARRGGSYHVLTGTSLLTGTRVLELDDVHRTLTGEPLPADGALVGFPSAYQLAYHPIAGDGMLDVLEDLVQFTAARYEAGPAPLSPHVHWWRAGTLVPLSVLSGGTLDYRPPEDFLALASRLAPAKPDLPAPRPHHYRFAHRVLPGAARLGEVPAERIGAVLQQMWEDFGAGLPEDQRLPPDGLSGGFVQDVPHRLLLVAMPRPRAATEAFAVALVWPDGSPDPRAFTLEYAVHPLTGEKGAVLGEWRDGNHHLLDLEMTPEARPFLQAVLRHAATPPPTPPKQKRRLFRRSP